MVSYVARASADTVLSVDDKRVNILHEDTFQLSATFHGQEMQG